MRDINRVNDNCISHRHVTDGGAGRRPRSSSREVSHPRASLAPPRRDAVGPVGKSPTSWRTGGRGLSVGLLSVSRLAPTAPRQLVATHSSRGTSGGLLFRVESVPDHPELHPTTPTYTPRRRPTARRGRAWCPPSGPGPAAGREWVDIAGQVRHGHGKVSASRGDLHTSRCSESRERAEGDMLLSRRRLGWRTGGPHARCPKRQAQ